MDRNLKNYQIVLIYLYLGSKHLSAPFIEILRIKNNLTLKWEEISKKLQDKQILMINLQEKREIFKRKNSPFSLKLKPYKDNSRRICNFSVISDKK